MTAASMAAPASSRWPMHGACWCTPGLSATTPAAMASRIRRPRWSTTCGWASTACSRTSPEPAWRPATPCCAEGCGLSAQAFPPALVDARLAHRQHLADLRRGQVDPALLRKRRDALQRIAPGVEGQVEGAVVHQVERARAEVLEGLHRLFGGHVHRGPVAVVGAVFHQGDVDGRQALADLHEAGEVARVAAVEDVLVAAAQRPRGPQRLVAVPWRAA